MKATVREGFIIRGSSSLEALTGLMFFMDELIVFQEVPSMNGNIFTTLSSWARVSGALMIMLIKTIK